MPSPTRSDPEGSSRNDFVSGRSGSHPIHIGKHRGRAEIRAMEHFNISVPEGLRAELDEGVREGGCPGPAEFIAALIRDHRQRRDELIAALIEDEESGIDERSIEDIIAEGRRRAGL